VNVHREREYLRLMKKGAAAKAEKSTKDGEDTERGADGPSVAAHPRAARNVARAKGWAGLAGFLVGGYLSLPTSPLAAVGLRALLAGIACYLAAWAGAVFVWRQLVMLEYAGASGRLSRRQAPVASTRYPSTPYQDTQAEHRRENVRIQAERPVVAYVGANRSRVQTFTIDISAGGLLVAGLEMLQKGDPFEFELAIAPNAPPIKGAGSVVRTDPQGRCAVVFKSISDADQRRLVQFIFEQQRAQHEKPKAA